MKLFELTAVAVVIGLAIPASGQEIDTSKPTNFYSFIDNTFEYTDGQNGHVYGYRGNLFEDGLGSSSWVISRESRSG